MRATLDLLTRIRWANVAKVAGLVVLVVVITAWPRLRERGPVLPSQDAVPVGVQGLRGDAATRGPGQNSRTAERVGGGDASTSTGSRERSRHQAAVAKRVRSKRAQRRRLARRRAAQRAAARRRAAEARPPSAAGVAPRVTSPGPPPPRPAAPARPEFAF